MTTPLQTTWQQPWAPDLLRAVQGVQAGLLHLRMMHYMQTLVLPSAIGLKRFLLTQVTAHCTAFSFQLCSRWASSNSAE